MARKPKTPFEDKPAEDVTAPSANGKMSQPGPKKKAITPPKKKAPAAVKKSSAEKPTTSTAKPAPSRPVEPTDDEIRIRAYFLAERRHQLSLPGDSAHDWIEARRQLTEEASR